MFGYADSGPIPQSVTFIQGNFKGDGTHGNFEAIVRVSPPDEAGPDTLDFWFFDSLRLECGDPVLLQSTYGVRGNFELLVPQGEVIRHYYRDNDDQQLPWHFLREFGFPTPPT